MRRIVILTTSCLAFACAGGGAGRQSSGVAEETSSSSDGTQDTIDPTVFGTSLADESSTAGSTTPTTGPGTTTVDTEDTTATGGEAPSVVMVTPDAEDAVPRDTPITITFSIDMDPDSIVADDGGCTGAVQVSVDDFATCEALEPAVAADARTFVVQPAAGLVSAASHRVRITTAAASAAGTPLLAEHTTRGFTARYGHTIAIDGGDDWAPGETFATSTDGHTAHLAWDDDYVYLGMRSPDVAGGQSSVWVVAYFGGDAGTDQGVLYNTQQPTLPFDAQYHLRWRADNIFTDVLAYDGAQWSPGGWTIGDGDVYAQADLLEMRVARADLGDPETLEVHTGLLREAMLDEASWGACPQTSYEDGYDPDYLAHWSFDLAGSTRPADHEPVQ